MARTRGHVYRRYVGHKIYLAALAARKAAPVVDRFDRGELDLRGDLPFWMDAPCCCGLTTCDECREEALFWEAEEEAQRAYEAECYRAQFVPEPEINLTGHMIAVEWEHHDGGRWWTTMDDGRLSWEIWHGRQFGVYLSDVDQIAA